MSSNITFDSDRPMQVRGVNGRLTHRTRTPGKAPGLWFKQRWVSESRPIAGYGSGALMRVAMRLDDECDNGHNTFSITAEVTTPESLRRRDIQAGGCLHEDIAAVFPELAPFIKWHLVSTDGPLHYIANTLYHASDRDYNGRAKGDPSAWEDFVYFGNSPVSHRLTGKFAAFLKSRMTADQDGGHYIERRTPTEPVAAFQVVAIAHERDPKTYGTHYTLVGFGDKWHECPFRTQLEAGEFCAGLNNCRVEFHRNATAYSEGKARDLDAARNAAAWPEATDEDLTAEREALRAALQARLPALLAAFRADMESAGFLWSPEDFKGE